MTNKPLTSVVIAAAAALGFAGSAFAKSPPIGTNPRTASICDAISGNLVTNCGFETGNFTGWTQTPATFGSIFNVMSGIQNSGISAAFFGATSPPHEDMISQSIPTVAGNSYHVSFFLENRGGGAPSQFTATFGGDTLLSLTDPGVLPYTEYTNTVAATSSSTTLSFSAYQVPDFFFLDDVSVVATAAAPEPASLGLLVLGLLGVGFARRKRRN